MLQIVKQTVEDKLGIHKKVCHVIFESSTRVIKDYKSKLQKTTRISQKILQEQVTKVYKSKSQKTTRASYKRLQ